MHRVVLSVVAAAMIITSPIALAKDQPGPGGDDRVLQNVITVSPSGGHFETIQEALDYVATIDPPPAEDNRFLIQIGPGVYQGPIEMLQWVDIVGSGIDVTTIVAEGGDSTMETHTVLGADDATLADLTVVNTGWPGTRAVAVSIQATSPTLRNVRVVSRGAEVRSVGVFLSQSDARLEDVTIESSGTLEVLGVDVIYGAPLLRNVDIMASGGPFSGGVRNNYSDPLTIESSSIVAGTGGEFQGVGVFVAGAWLVLRDVEIVADAASEPVALWIVSSHDIVIDDCALTSTGSSVSSYAVFEKGVSGVRGARSILDSRLRGTTASIANTGDGTYRVGASWLDGPVVNSSVGDVVCVASFNGEFETLSRDCQVEAAVTPTPTP